MSKLELGTLPQWLMFIVFAIVGLWVRWHLGAIATIIDRLQAHGLIA